MTIASRRREAEIERRRRVDEIKLAAGCMDCGYNAHPRALQFDHRPGTVKRWRISGSEGRAWSEVLIEIEKCDVVCANCHAIRTSERPHTGGPAAWKVPNHPRFQRTPEVIADVIAARAAGETYRSIGRRLHITSPTIRRIITDYEHRPGPLP